MINWREEKEKLEKYICDGVAYEEIGRIYGCTGANIKKQAKKLGITLLVRRHTNENETFNRGKNAKYCKVCGKKIGKGSFCSHKCANKFARDEKTKKWLNGENFVRGTSQVPGFIRDYLFNEFNGCCEICGWGEENKFSGTVPLEIHHIDGDCTNNLRNNLQLLCPNCHSLTSTNGNLNKSSKRFHQKRRKIGDE